MARVLLHHNRSLSRVDEETTAHDDWILKLPLVSVPSLFFLVFPSSLLFSSLRFSSLLSSLLFSSLLLFFLFSSLLFSSLLFSSLLFSSLLFSLWRHEDARNVFRITQHGEVCTVDASAC